MMYFSLLKIKMLSDKCPQIRDQEIVPKDIATIIKSVSKPHSKLFRTINV